MAVIDCFTEALEMGLWLLGNSKPSSFRFNGFEHVLFAIRLHDLEHLLKGLVADVFFDYYCVQGFSSVHVLVNLYKVMVGAVEIEALLLRGQFELGCSAWEFSGLHLHDLLEIDCAHIVSNPLQFEATHVDPCSHCEEEYYLIGHEFDVLLGIAKHELVLSLLIDLQLMEVLVVLVQASNEHQDLVLGLPIQLLGNSRRILAVMDGVCLLFVFDIGLEEADFVLKFCGSFQCVYFEFQLIKELGVAVVVFDDAKGFFLVQFMLLDLLQLIVRVLMQHILHKRVFILLQSSTLHALMEVGWDQFVEVFLMHELRVQFLQQFLVKLLFKDLFIFAPQPQEGGVDRLERRRSCHFADAALLACGLVYLEGVSLNKEDVGQKQFQAFRPAHSQSVQQLLQPNRCDFSS